MKIDQFVYTKGKGGYQVVASSDGISKDVVDGMKCYMYPAGVDPLKFSESRSLVLLDGDLAAYSIVQNVGIGPDGRDGTFYNHTLVMDVKEFQNLGCDSRSLDRLYLGGVIQGDTLPTLSVNPPEVPPMPSGDVIPALEGALEALFSDKKLAVISDDLRLPQEVLMALPRHLRLVPFSTMVISPRRQPGYRLIMNPDFYTDPPDGFTIVDPKNPAKSKEYITHYSRLVCSHQRQRVKEIQRIFKSLPEGDALSKLGFSCSYVAYNKAEMPEKAIKAEQILHAAKELGEKTRSMFYDRIRGDLTQDVRCREDETGIQHEILSKNRVVFTPSKQQKLVIDHRLGNLAVAARPGSGKTETISRRVAAMITEMRDKNEKADGIVAFTFTIKAAEELRTRIRRNLRSDVNMPHGMFVGTIDSYCLNMLRKIDPKYNGYDMLGNLERVAFIDSNYTKIKIHKLKGWSRGNVIKKFCDSVDIVMKENISLSDISNKNFVKSYCEYQKILKEKKFMDFGTVVDRLLKLLDTEERIDMLGVRHLVIDEYQDNDSQQQKLIDLLSKSADSVCAVGDTDQTIFQWRGSDPSRLEEFKNKAEASGGLSIELTTNYRATEGLVECASRLIGRNHGVEKIDMRADPEQPNKFKYGEIIYKTSDSKMKECEFIHESIQSLVGKKFETKNGSRRISHEDIAILVQTNKDATTIANFLRTNMIECEVEGGTAGFKDPVAGLALNCLLYALGYEDGQTMEDLEKEYSWILGGDLSSFRKGMYRAVEEANRYKPRIKYSRRGSRVLLQVISAMGAERGSVRNHMRSLGDLSKAVAGYEYANGGLTAGQARRLGRFIEALDKYGFSVSSDRGASGKVRIMTIWKAKGLEFPVVFVPKLVKKRDRGHDEQNYVDRSLYPSVRYRGGTESDRRLFYTAVTRSQKYLILTDTKSAIQDFKTDMGDDTIPKKLVTGDNVEGGSPIRTTHLSYEGIDEYERCPHEYYLRHIIEYKEGLEPLSDYGKNIGILLSRIHAMGREGNIPSDEEIEKMAEATFHMRFVSKPRAAKFQKNAVGLLARYAKNHKMILGNAGSDVKVGHEFNGSGITDIADLIDRDGKVTMFEEGRDAENDHDKHAARAKFCSISAGGDKGYVYYLFTGQKHQAEAEDTLARISRAITGINSRNFDATPERSKCKGCDFVQICDRKGSILDES